MQKEKTIRIDMRRGRKLVRLRRLARRAGNVVYWTVVAASAALVLRYLVLVVFFETFHTPTDSIPPTLQPGDHGYIDKLKLGGRIFDFYAAARGERVTVRRLPGYGRLERGDVIVFNATFDERWDSVALNMYRYYCKRAVAVAGDTLEAVGGFYRVRGDGSVYGVKGEQRLLRQVVDDITRQTPDSVGLPNWITIGPRDSLFNWTIRDFGPYVIPREGMTMRIDRRNYLLYRKYIEWETGRKLEWTEAGARLGGIPLPAYTFTEDYCFAAGDHAVDSQDSRYWGLVPEKFIVGVARFVFKSKRGMRWL